MFCFVLFYNLPVYNCFIFELRSCLSLVHGLLVRFTWQAEKCERGWYLRTPPEFRFQGCGPTVPQVTHICTQTLTGAFSFVGAVAGMYSQKSPFFRLFLENRLHTMPFGSWPLLGTFPKKVKRLCRHKIVRKRRTTRERKTRQRDRENKEGYSFKPDGLTLKLVLTGAICHLWSLSPLRGLGLKLYFLVLNKYRSLFVKTTTTTRTNKPNETMTGTLLPQVTRNHRMATGNPRMETLQREWRGSSRSQHTGLSGPKCRSTKSWDLRAEGAAGSPLVSLPSLRQL